MATITAARRASLDAGAILLAVLGAAVWWLPGQLAAAAPDAPLIDSAVIATAITAAAGIAVAALASRSRRRSDNAGDEDQRQEDERNPAPVPQQRSRDNADRIDILLHAMQDLQQDNRAFRDENRQLTATVERLERKVDDLAGQLAARDQIIDEQRAQIGELRNQLEPRAR